MSSNNNQSSSADDTAASSHKMLTYNRRRPTAKTGNSDTLRKKDGATKDYRAQHTILSFVLAVFVMTSGLMSGHYNIDKNYLFVSQGNLKIVQNQIMKVASYSNRVITDLFSIISFPSAHAAESSIQSDSSSEGKGNVKPNQSYCLETNPDGSCRAMSNLIHIINHLGQVEIKMISCDTDYDEDNDHTELVAVEHSQYQRVFFEENLVMEDKCLWLDHTMQQCSTFRPHYHEPFVHLSAAYTDVKRVVFVGGGDSMLLHEVLKYPSLEMVLGLELDQVVTRNSFEHFKTQPHFDDERVQWWFGDGAKSLTLLPREYFGTFDLVLLDLSETVMSKTVTKGLDVFGAMKLLLSPTGIMVKNDFGYFDRLSR
eukprot:scaffold14225_cov97-Skeletonema_dohrnii-CCMP3373.AAC.1